MTTIFLMVDDQFDDVFLVVEDRLMISRLVESETMTEKARDDVLRV